MRELLDGFIEFRYFDFFVNRIEDVKSVMLWILIYNMFVFDVKFVVVVIEVRCIGYVIVDGFVGELMVSAIRYAFANFVDEDEDARIFSKGEFD